MIGLLAPAPALVGLGGGGIVGGKLDGRVRDSPLAGGSMLALDGRLNPEMGRLRGGFAELAGGLEGKLAGKLMLLAGRLVVADGVGEVLPGL